MMLQSEKAINRDEVITLWCSKHSGAWHLADILPYSILNYHDILYPLKVKYIQKMVDKQDAKEKNIEAIKTSFQPRSLAPADTEPEEFSF